MATEKRLIDANEAYEIARLHHKDFAQSMADLTSLREVLEDAPTVDAVEVPCKMGDEVWGLKKYRGRQIPKQGIVCQMYFGDDMRLCISVKNVCRGEWGKNVFATRKEAETAIGERRTNG